MKVRTIGREGTVWTSTFCGSLFGNLLFGRRHFPSDFDAFALKNRLC
jgi:hypothetical protein